MANVFWVGNNGNTYLKTADGVADLGQASGTRIVVEGAEMRMPNGVLATKVANPSSATGALGESTGQLTGDTVDKDVAERNSLRADITAGSSTIDELYNSLYGDLDTVLKSRDSDLVAQYGGQRDTAGKNYTEAIPVIDQGYAALGSYDSTQRTDSRGKAKTGYEDTLKTIGQNEKSDQDKIGQYGRETKTKIDIDRDTARRNGARVNETDDVGALRGYRNDLESNLDSAKATKATLGTNAGNDIKGLTGDNGRGDAAINALDAVIKSSLPTDVKQAAVTAVTDSAGLSDEEKKRVQATYGNVFAEQSAL